MPEPTNPRGFNRPLHKLFGHKLPINRLAWSPIRDILATPSLDRTVRLWDIAQPGTPLHTLQGHRDRVNSVAWSPDGNWLASCSGDSNVIVWDPFIGRSVETLRGHNTTAFDVAWSPDGALLAVGYRDGSVVLWNMQRYQRLHALTGHHGGALCLAWSHNGRWLFVGAADRTIRMWDMERMRDEILGEHSGAVYHLCASPDGRRLASASQDNTIQIWGDMPAALEGQTGAVTGLSFSADSRFLASKSLDGKVRIWRSDTLDAVAVIDEPSSYYWSASLVFHPGKSLLASLGEDDRMIRVWRYHPKALIEADPIQQMIRYTNAKVVLVGDKGAGKSKLSDALRGKSFTQPSEPDHQRRIWWLHREHHPVETEEKLHEMREVMLWDIGGEPAYRIVNQLHLNEVALALMVFNSQQEQDPFGGIHYWHRALRHARQVQGDIHPIPTMRFLVAGQLDEGAINVSQDALDKIQRDLAFDGYFDTSAKDNLGIKELSKALRTGIDWERLPKVSSTALFHRIKNFLLEKREEGHILHTMEQLFDTYVDQCEDGYAADGLYEEFDTCTRLLAAQGVLKRFSFGGLVLLQPEVLDDYAFAMIMAARQQAEGWGFIYEDDALNGRFPMPKGKRLQDQYQEAQMLVATVDDLNKFDVAIRDVDPRNGKSMLVFPSQVTRAYSDAIPVPDDTTSLWEFEGAISSIYSTLVARLWRSDLFDWNGMYRGMAFFRTPGGGYYCLALRSMGEGRARLMRYGADDSTPRTVMMLDEYIHEHLRRYTSGRVRRKAGASRGGSAMRALVRQSWVDHMNTAIEEQHQRDRARYAVQGKQQVADFDVFLSYNWADFDEVMEVADQLKQRHGILPWFDRWEVQGGDNWDDKIQQQLDHLATQGKAMVFFAGAHGLGKTQRDEMAYALDIGMRIIPVFLKSAQEKQRFPIRIARRSRIDFRISGRNAEGELVRAIRQVAERFPRDIDV